MMVLRRDAFAPFLLAGVLAVAGCKGSANHGNSNAQGSQPPVNPATASQDTGGQGSSGSYPAPGPGSNGNGGGTSTPANPPTAPNGTTQGGNPLPAPPLQGGSSAAQAPSPMTYTAPAGTPIEVRTNGAISSKAVQVGDHFSGTLERPIVEHGHVLVARGEPVEGEIVAANQKGRFKGPGDLAITVHEIGHHHVDTSDYEKVEKGRGGRSTALIAGGTGVGALIGGLAGHGRGALIGGLAGAGAGTAGAAATGNRSVVIPAETVVTLTLRSPLSVEGTH